MNTREAIRSTARIGSFCARHGIALVVTVGVGCVCWTILYFTLLLWAVAGNEGLGSPVAYPIGLILIVAAGTGIGLTLLLPSTALAEWYARRRGWPVLAQVPISMGLLALLCLCMFTIAARDTPIVLRGLSKGFWNLWLINLIPLGIYWWTAQSVPLVLSLVRRWAPENQESEGM